ncbi:hypothetical protein ACFFIF_09215 [Vagococcus entomophilus]|uniref:Condensation domain-containing protein n=1 Tax=Vagococcus entomophilus TaxID=1160095 RepID=A0A430AGU5_9ENTE|nr:hypothetical protein [Vagococcus entomophilus]RSU07067.1 hypothetical protein CBF30_07360 [Vagococcus entomophilus]
MANLNKVTNEKIKSEKIRTGQSFLYRKDGFESMVFEINLKQKISGVLLQQAFAQVIAWYPYLTQKFVERQGDFYLVENTVPFWIRNSAACLPLGGSATGGHLLDVHYQEQTIYVDFHHGLCDGRGILPFIRGLTRYYIGLCTQDVEQILRERSNDQKAEFETLEPGNIELLATTNNQLPTITKKGYSLPEARAQKERVKESCLTKVRINADSLLSFGKQIGATPAISMSYLFSKAIWAQKLVDEEDLAVVCNLVSDLRGASPVLERTHRNCVSSLQLPYNGKNCAPKQYAQKSREKLQAFKQPENLRNELKKVRSLSDQLDKLPSFKQKQEALSFFDTLLTDTFILSYVGRMELKEAEPYIESIHTYSSGTRGVSIEMLAVEKEFYLDIMQSFEQQEYIQAFFDQLEKYAIEYTIESTRKVKTPKDDIQKIASNE